jgi:hypothetical protein
MALMEQSPSPIRNGRELLANCFHRENGVDINPVWEGNQPYLQLVDNLTPGRRETHYLSEFQIL